MLLKSKQDAEEFVFWCVTLQCEVIPKAQGALQNPYDDSCCCLGTGMACTVPEDKIIKNNDNRMSGVLPQPGSPKWLIDINTDFEVKYGRNKYLTSLNDDQERHWSHKEIGTLLLELYKDEIEYWGI